MGKISQSMRTCLGNLTSRGLSARFKRSGTLVVTIMRRCCGSVIRVYQYIISPYVGSVCRYTPSCSEYAYAVIIHVGVVKGCYLSIRRLLRCHPWGGHGYDPAPSKRQ